MFGFFRKKEIETPKPRYSLVAHDFDRGCRVEVLQTAGFDRGAKGTVAFVQKYGQDDGSDSIWIDRDGAGSAVWYHPSELKFEDPPQGNLEQKRRLTAARPFVPSI